MNRKKTIILSLIVIFLMSFNVFATNVEVAEVPGVIKPEGFDQNVLLGDGDQWLPSVLYQCV